MVDVVDELAALLEEFHQRVPTVLVLEPGAFEALVLRHEHCGNGATIEAYQRGIRYAVEEVSYRAQSTAMYLAVGSGRTLGWGTTVHELMTQLAHLGVAYAIRGFATNVGDYQPLGVPCPLTEGVTLSAYCQEHPHSACCADPCNLLLHFNQANNEHNYVQLLAKHLRVAFPGLTPHFLIDTGRNGVDRSREDCADTCNVRAAGFGRRPTGETGFDLVDGYFWVKPPGESDGCRRGAPSCSSPDVDCAVEAALGSRAGEPAAPAAGAWFAPHAQALAMHALEVPAQSALDAAAREYRSFASGGGGAVGSGGDDGKSVGRLVGISILLVVVLALWAWKRKPGAKRHHHWELTPDSTSASGRPQNGSARIGRGALPMELAPVELLETQPAAAKEDAAMPLTGSAKPKTFESVD